MSNLVDFLLSSKERSSADSVILRQRGEQAAFKYVQEGVPLNDSLAGMAKEASWNREQVQRAVEFANNKTFVERFQQPYDKNVQFPVADTDEVLRKINGELTVVKTASLNLRQAKPYRPGQELGSLEELFGGRSLEKTASVHSSFYREQAVKQYRGAKDQLRLVEQARDGLENQFNEKLASLQRVVSREIKSGEQPWVIGAAVAAANPSRELFSYIAEELDDDFDYQPMHKLAQFGMALEEGNQVTGLVQDLQNIMGKLQAQEEHVMQVKQAIDGLLMFLQGPPEVNPTEQLFQDDPSKVPLPPPPPPPPMPPPGAGPPQGGPPQGGPPPQ